MAKKGAVNPRSPIVKARAVLSEQQRRLADVPVELQVKDLDHAKTPEVIQFCVNHLVGGGRWEELRKKLGLGPAHLDYRWRRLREILVDGLVPTSEEQALKAQSDKRAYLVMKLEEFEQDLEGTIQVLGGGKEDMKAFSALMKLKLDTMKTLLEENSREFLAYVELQKAKKQDRIGRGTSVIIQNNFHIPRPGDDKKLIDQTTERVVAAIEEKHAVGDGD